MYGMLLYIGCRIGGKFVGANFRMNDTFKYYVFKTNVS